MKNIINKILIIGLLVTGLAVAMPNASMAQVGTKIDSVQSNKDKNAFSDIDKQLVKIEKSLKNNDISQIDIDKYLSFLGNQEVKIGESRKELEKQLKFLQKQLDALGEGPKEGEFEDAAITKQREELSQKMATQDRMIKEADLLIIKIEDLNVQMLNARNQQTYGDLMTKQSAFINPMVFFRGFKAYMKFFWDVTKSPVDWYKNIPEGERTYALSSIVVMFFILMIALTLATFLKRFILRNWGYKDDVSVPHFNRKVIAAIAVATARGLIFAFLVIGCILWMVSTRIFGESLLNTVLMTTAMSTLLAIVEATISRVTFAPRYPQWRLINIPSEKAARFTRMIFTFILVNMFASVQVLVAQRAEYSMETVHFVIILDCAVKAFFLMWLSKITFDTYKDEMIDSSDDNIDDGDLHLSHGFKVILFSHIFCILTFIASLMGYPELSLFIFNHVIMSLILCGVFEILRRSLIDISKRIIIAGPWMKKVRSSKKAVAKIVFWLKMIINPIIVLVLLFMLLNLWGLPGDFILQLSKKLLFGFKIGGIQISLIAIVLGILVFFASLTFVKVVRTKLADNFLAKIDMDDGVKHSLISGVSFVGFIVSTLLAIIAMGVDLTNLAFIAGALSVGIGFGLQDVIKNLVSGIIILLERPFRVGDWVIMNGEEGKIKQINIRSTEMETFRRTSVIVPNATLLSSAVTNLTHGNNMARQSIKVGVSYNSDPEEVRKILLDCAKEFKEVMKSPAPYVLFQDFGSSSLDFELRYYIKDLWASWETSSNLRYVIFRKFAEYGIEIPFPQVVVNKPSVKK